MLSVGAVQSNGLLPSPSKKLDVPTPHARPNSNSPFILLPFEMSAVSDWLEWKRGGAYPINIFGGHDGGEELN